jgi:hypothetical protein
MNVAEMVTFAVATYILTGSESPWLYVSVLLLGMALYIIALKFQVFAGDILLYWLTPGLHYDPQPVKTDQKNILAVWQNICSQTLCYNV